jgi:hypothetical protein
LCYKFPLTKADSANYHQSEEIQVKRLMLPVLAFLALATISRAQDTPVADVAGGYSFLYVVKGFTLATNGGSASVALHANNWLGLVGDFGAYHGSAASLTLETYTFGLRFSSRKNDRFVPFSQALLGGSHASMISGGFTGLDSFVFGGGGGADIALGRRGKFALRPQLEYFGFRANGITTNTIRLSFGIVYRLGRK